MALHFRMALIFAWLLGVFMAFDLFFGLVLLVDLSVWPWALAALAVMGLSLGWLVMAAGRGAVRAAPWAAVLAPLLVGGLAVGAAASAWRYEPGVSFIGECLGD